MARTNHMQNLFKNLICYAVNQYIRRGRWGLRRNWCGIFSGQVQHNVHFDVRELDIFGDGRLLKYESDLVGKYTPTCCKKSSFGLALQHY